jgi:hypothetical protein
MRHLKFPLALAVIGAIAMPGVIANADSSKSLDSESIQECISANRNLDVLMLVDESKSLRVNGTEPGYDPMGLRVEALTSVAQVLASTVDAGKVGIELNSEDQPLKVQLSIAGFGANYTTRKPFAEFSGVSLSDVIEIIEEQRDLDDDLFTRYHTGLAGALEDFKSRASEDSKACRILLWFSDGVHDDDNKNGFSTSEIKQINDELCGEGGIADELRKEGVFIVAAGLNSDEKELGLMRLIAFGGEPFSPTVKDGRKSILVDRCGSIDPFGEFELADNADEIIDKLFSVLKDVPGIPSDSVELPTCSDGTVDCNEMRFTADESISSFSILATRPNTDVEVILQMPNGQDVRALTGKGEVSGAKNVATFYKVSDRKVLITVRRGPEALIDGTWALQFIGVGSSTSVGAVNFVGRANIALDGDAGVEGKLEINRFDAKPIAFTIKAASSETSIRNAQITLSNFEASEDVFADRPGLGRFELSKQVLERALKDGQLKKASSATLKVLPVGDVPGLTTSDGLPVKVDFNAQTFEVLITNGANLPFFKGVKSTDLSFKGTPTKTLELLFDGPDGGDGFVDFGQFIQQSGGKADFEVVGTKSCKVTQKQIDAVCEIKIVPNVQTYGKYNLQLGVTYRSSAEESQEGEITIPVSTTLPTDAGKGVLAALQLIAIFVLIQGLVRLLLSYLMSRYAPLDSTARKVRLDAVVDASGGLTLNPMNVNLSHNDEGFAFENIDSTPSFNIFGYQFSCSILRTFLKSTSSPMGVVSLDSTVVVGSRGVQYLKNDPQVTNGLVELSLRGQWIVGVKTAEVHALLNGSINVPAEVVAFFDPYERPNRDRNTQIAELSLTVASSNFASDFSGVLMNIKDSIESDGTETQAGITEDPWGSSTANVEGTQNPQIDIFGDSLGPVATAPIESKSKKSKRIKEKKSKRTESTNQNSSDNSGSGTNDDWDPFA